MRSVAVLGIGITPFGEMWDKSLREIGIQAGFQAIMDAGIGGKDVDALYLGNMSSGSFVKQEHIAPLIAEHVGLTKWHTPAVRVEAADASGGLALRQGYLSVASGLEDIVVVGGAEKMSDLPSYEVTETLAEGADQEWEAFFGATMDSLYAMMARWHMATYGTTREALAHVAVKNHYHGARNPNAQFRRETTVERVLGAPWVAEPLTVFDCAPTSDGAAAVILCSLDIAKEYTDLPIVISGSGQASDTMALHDRAEVGTMEATAVAAQRAFEQSGHGPNDIDVAEVHDSYTIAEIMAIEDLGFYHKGEAAAATVDGETRIGGSIPINPSGGLKARGHPVGATGVAQVVEVVQQLRGDGDKRQVDGATVGLAHNVGGTGGTAVVHILEAI